MTRGLTPDALLVAEVGLNRDDTSISSPRLERCCSLQRLLSTPSNVYTYTILREGSSSDQP